jgi:hypothetical protein
VPRALFAEILRRIDLRPGPFPTWGEASASACPGEVRPRSFVASRGASVRGYPEAEKQRGASRITSSGPHGLSRELMESMMAVVEPVSGESRIRGPGKNLDRGGLMASILIRAAVVALLVAVVPPGAQVAADDAPLPPIERFVIFGDSLSDPGNTFAATGEFAVRPFAPIPAAPYLIGRFHFSNGPTWVEQLAKDFRLPRSGKPALLRSGVYTNYASGELERARRGRSTSGFSSTCSWRISTVLPRPRRSMCCGSAQTTFAMLSPP